MALPAFLSGAGGATILPVELDAAFPETTWGVVCAFRPRDAAERRAGMETLCRRYWAPIHRFVQAALALPPGDDAGDLTQDFFVWLLEGDVLARFVPERGSFRAYLKGLLRNYARNAVRAARREKRGGGARPVPLDDLPQDPADPRWVEAERAFDRAWVEEVTARALERVRASLEGGKHAVRWALFQAYDLADRDARPSYAELAARHGLKEKDVSNHLQAARERLRREARLELGDTVASPEDLEDEWRALVG